MLRASSLWFVMALALAACRSSPVMPEVEPDPTPVEVVPRPVEPTPAPEPQSAKPPLIVRIIDVGQGDGMLIIGPTGKTVLIDAGDVGADRAVLAQLAADHITTLDLAIMSHPHADHIGGMQKVLAQVPARLFMDPGFDQPSPIYADLLQHLTRDKTPIVIARAGRRIDLGGDARLDVLAPEDPLLSGTRSDANANSIVLRLVYGGSTMLFTGDSEAPTEDRITSSMTTMHADVLKVAHHGSRFSTQDDFLAAVDPSIAVISCGTNNRFKHPAPETLQKLERQGIDIWRTDQDGTLTLTSDGRRWRVEGAKRSVGLASQRPEAAR